MNEFLTKLKVLVISLKSEIFTRVYTKTEIDNTLVQTKKDIITDVNETVDTKLSNYDASINTKVEQAVTDELATMDVVTNDILNAKGYATSTDVANTYASKTSLDDYLKDSDLDAVKIEITDSVTTSVEGNIDASIDNKLEEVTDEEINALLNT